MKTFQFLLFLHIFSETKQRANVNGSETEKTMFLLCNYQVEQCKEHDIRQEQSFGSHGDRESRRMRIEF